ncbi:MAG: ankyrin repeat domain-containing protein [Armatimonadota bacterium]
MSDTTTCKIVPTPSGKLATRSSALAGRGLALLKQMSARARHRGLGWTSLHIASLGDHRREAEMLIAQGEDVNAQDKFGHTPLFFAKSAYMAQVLIAHGADVNARRHDGGTALHRAARSGSRPVAKLLIHAGANVNAVQSGTTPLHVAARHGHWTVAELLISSGADIDAIDDLGQTPLSEAESGGHGIVAGLLRRHSEVMVE